MKSLLFPRTLVLTAVALAPVAWLVSGCGGGGGGASGGNSGGATATPRATSTPVGTATPIPTPTVPVGGQRIFTPIELGNAQKGTLNLVVNRFGAISGIITVPPIPADAAGVFRIQSGTYPVTGQFTLPANFTFGGTLKTVAGENAVFKATGKIPFQGNRGQITVTVGNSAFPTQTF